MEKVEYQIADLLLAIEAQMRRLALWGEQPPEPERLESLVPFCHDTLEFHQWLQWVFLPQMKRLLENGQTLPTECDIYPLAEYSFNQQPTDAAQLLTLILNFDRLISRNN